MPKLAEPEFGPRKMHVNMMFTVTEYDKLKEMAEKHGTTMTGYVRQAIREKMLLEGEYYIKLGEKLYQIGGIL